MSADSFSFDRVAHIYDETRAIPPAQLEEIADRIVRVTWATSSTRILEIGIGTGRIALPIARRGVSYAGVDISEKMTDVLRGKAAESRVEIELAYADIAQLPFPDASFDVVVAVHILHLVPEWRKALDEVRRVLKPRGQFVLGQEHGETGMYSQIRGQWRTFVIEAGGEFRPAYGTWDRVDAALTEMGAYTAVYRAANWTGTFEPAELLHQLRNQVFSGSWGLSQEALEAADERIRRWAADLFGDLGVEHGFSNEFLMLAASFP